MKPFLVLLITAALVLLTGYTFHHRFDLVFAARWAMSVMLVFTSIAHIAFPLGMAMMIPSFIPYKRGLVYLTGIFEIAAAIGLQMAGLRTITCWLLIIFFILITPANIHAALQRINYEKATRDGKGPAWLWFRIPLQILFIAWVYFCIG